MPIVSNSVLSHLTSSTVLFPVLKKIDSEKDKTDSDLAEKMISVNNNYHELFYQSSNAVESETKKGLLSYLRNITSWNRRVVEPEDITLNKILARGMALRQDAEKVAEQLQQSDEIQPTTFSLKTKPGILLGTMLLLAECGAGFYSRRRQLNEEQQYFYSKKTLNKAGDAVRNYTVKNNLAPVDIISDKINIRKKKMASFMGKDKNPKEVYDNRYDLTDRTVPRCRDRLISYLYRYAYISEETKNEELAWIMLSLLSQSPIHKTWLARISLYGTGLFGEKSDEAISLSVQHLLVGDLLSLLLYGQSPESYLISVFSKKRYISIKDFSEEIIKNDCQNNSSELSNEMNYFHENYLNPAMPLLSLELSEHSNILVGSITWFLMYLSSATEWLEAKKYDETQAITQGITILHHFLSGTLEESSQAKINLGLKFCALHFNASLTPETLPEFSLLWDIYRGEYIKHAKFSYDIEKNAVKIINDIKEHNIEISPWDSQNEFTEKILLENCLKKHPFLFHLKDNKRQRISVREYINSTTERVWCIQRKKNTVTDAYEYYSIKLPIVKYKYEKLLNNVLNIIKDINRLYLSIAFNKNDYFNAEIDEDDFTFINISALKVVSLTFRERLVTKANPFTPRFKLTEGKSNFLFFVALHYGERRIYAIDITHKKPLQKVREGADHIIKNKNMFFNVEYRNLYKDMDLIVSDTNKINISISRKDPTSLFIERITNHQIINLQKIINKQNAGFLYLEEVILESIKDILLPFYSCTTSIQRDDLFGAVVSCLFDLFFIVLPTGKTTIRTTGKLTERMIDMVFMIQRNHFFNHGGRIYWRRIINDSYVYNSVVNQRTMLRTVFIQLLLDNIDPGVGLVKDISMMFKHAALNIMKGELIRLPLVMIKKLKSIIEFSVRAKSIIDSSKKIIIKATKSSGKLAKGKNSSAHSSSNDIFSFPLYDSAYQSGDYYGYYTSRDDVDLLIAITEEKSEDEEFIYVILGEDEFQGVLFRFTFRESASGEPNLIPWVPIETSARNIHHSSSIKTTLGQEMKFNHDINHAFDNVIYYPDHLCHLSGDRRLKEDAYEIFKINGIHYLFNSQGGYLRPVYDGDASHILKRDEFIIFNAIKKDYDGGVIISRELIGNDHKKIKCDYKYSFSNVDTSHLDRMRLCFNYDSLFLSSAGCFSKLTLTNIKSQFIVNVDKYDASSFIVTWHSIENKFVPAKPYLKKSSSHVSISLENKIMENCQYTDTLNKYPTLLLSGAIYCKSELKLRIDGSYYPLVTSGNGRFYLKCNSGFSAESFEIFYDLFTESFELAPHRTSDIPPEYRMISPYDELISQIFPVKKNADMVDLINLNSSDYNNKLTMRLHQAAFLQRLNPIDRMDVLLLPVAQVYSWALHKDTLPFQRRYPAAALWMTWQRQLSLLIKNKRPDRLSRVGKIQLQTEGEYITADNGFLISSRYTDNEIIWIGNDEKQQPLALYTSEIGFYSKNMDVNNGVRQWFPTVKNARPLSVTQFMYEKDIHPKITVFKNNRSIRLIDYHRYSEHIHIEFDLANRDYFIISPGGEWAASIDDTHKVMIYNLWEKKSRYFRNSNPFIQVSDSSTLLDFHSRNYHLLMLSDDGTLYYPEDNSWRDSKQNKYLWSPPKDFLPSFISHDYRFIGFKNKEDFDVILYDQKRKLAILLKRPLGILYNGYITAVSFSALNAVVALAFNDGCVYLYDLISDRQESSINPIAHVKLNNIINGREYNNILMRFEGIFNTLTIIHSEGVWNSSSQVDEAVYIRSSYGFHHTAHSH